MPWLLIGYMFLFVHRPFEVWPMLADLRVERVYMAITVAAWTVLGAKRLLPNPLHILYALFALTVLAAWVASPWMERSQPLVEDYFKIVVFYALLVTSISDEKSLKKMIIGFIGVMVLYLSHSLKEYMAGRHTYRMGITRMIGVDTTLGDPNSFGASIVFALPFVVCLWRVGVGGRVGRLCLLSYVGLSALCILLTGSRSSLLGFTAWALMLLMSCQRRIRFLVLACVLAPICFVALPPSLQNRFETIIDSDVGPANAKESGEGRVQGLLMGLDLWASNPLVGVGPGAWRPATRQPLESHNLYGQLAGELGSAGLVAFLGLLVGFAVNVRRVRSVARRNPDWANDLPFQVANAVGVGVLLLLFMGNFGHNLFRFSWLWYGGFLVIARYCAERRLRESADETESDVDDEYDWEPEAAERWLRPEPPAPVGWTWHKGHVRPGVQE